MRKPAYLSPTALNCFEKSVEDYYVQYLMEPRVPRDPQTAPMAVGSSFDAYVKCSLAVDLLGPERANELNLDFDRVFNSQVEEHNRDKARIDGSYVFGIYKSSGAYAALRAELEKSPMEPQLDLKITFPFTPTPVGVEQAPLVLHARPDLVYWTPEGTRIVLDWKVNGFYAQKPPSPAPKYRTCWDYAGKAKTHKDFVPMYVDGVLVHGGMLGLKDDWATQLTTYGWSVGDGTFGGEDIYHIEQIIGKLEWRIAQHVHLIPRDYRVSVYERYLRLWREINSGFTCLTEARKGELVAAYTNTDFRACTHED